MYIYDESGDYTKFDEDGVETDRYGGLTGRTLEEDGRIYDGGTYTGYIGSDGIVRDTCGHMTGEKDY